MDGVIMCLRLFGLYHAYVCVTLGVSGLLISRCKSLFFQLTCGMKLLPNLREACLNLTKRIPLNLLNVGISRSIL